MSKKILIDLLEKVESHADNMINLSLVVGSKCLKKEVLEESEEILIACKKIFDLITSEDD